MKSRGLEKTSAQMLTLFLSSLLLCLPTMSPSDIQFQPPLSCSPLHSAAFPISHPDSFSYLLSLLLRLTPSLISRSLHTFCLSHHLFSSLTLPSCLAPLTAGTVQISRGNCTTDRQRRGALLTLKAALYGRQCMQ